MESAVKNIEVLYEKAKEYTQTTIELYKLIAVEKTAEVLASLVFRIAFLCLAAFFILFSSIGLSFYLGELLHSTAIGFLLVSFVYLILTILLYSFRDKWIKAPISNLIIKELLYSKSKGKSDLEN